MSSIEPDDCGGQVDAGQEASCGLVVAGGNGPELLELGEEVLDQMPGLVEVFVEGARCLPGFPRWDDGRLASLGQRFEHPLVRIERLVGNERLGLKLREQRIGSGQIMLLTAGQVKADRIAKRIHQGVDLGGQPALATADGLVWPSFLGCRPRADARARSLSRSSRTRCRHRPPRAGTPAPTPRPWPTG